LKRTMRTLLWLALASSLAAQDLPPGAADFIRGQQAMRDRDTDAAIEAFKRALSANPDLFLSHYYLGYAYQSQGDWENAGAHFSLFLTLVDEEDPVAAQIVFHAKRQGGLAMGKTDNPARAARYLASVVDADPNDEDAHYYLGVAELAEGNPDLAQRLFERVITLTKANAEAYYYSGRIAFEKGDLELARKRLARFVQLKPHSPFGSHGHLMLGQLARGAQDTEEAIAHFEQCLALEPEGSHADQARRALSELKPPEAGPSEGGA
jgi:tetratricopeptide (TPR) repeat protein